MIELFSLSVKCEKLTPPMNGVVSPVSCLANPIEGEECRVSCDDGFAMTDGTDYKLLTCDVSGTWTGEMLPCHGMFLWRSTLEHYYAFV